VLACGAEVNPVSEHNAPHSMKRIRQAVADAEQMVSSSHLACGAEVYPVSAHCVKIVVQMF
jgi:hypothetical protein